VQKYEPHDIKKVGSDGLVNVGRARAGTCVEIKINGLNVTTTTCQDGRFLVKKDRVSVGRKYAGEDAEIYYLKDE